MREKLSPTNARANIGCDFMIFMLAFFRVVKFALIEMGRNISLSFMTVLILVLMLLSVNTLIAIRVLTTTATTAVKEQIDLSVFFKPQADEQAITEIRRYVQSFPEVVRVVYVSPGDGLDKFRNDHRGNKDILASLDELGNNPFGGTLIVKAREPRDYSKIMAALSVPEYEQIIQAKTFADIEKAVERIHTITTNVERFSLGLSALFAVIAFLIVFNTVRVAIYTQRMEISIKKLVGATNWFIRGPYLVEALFFSVTSMAVTGVGVLLGARFLDPYVGAVFADHGFLTNYFSSHILPLFGAQFVAVLFLTVVTSLLAMRKYLRV